MGVACSKVRLKFEKSMALRGSLKRIDACSSILNTAFNRHINPLLYVVSYVKLVLNGGPVLLVYN